MAPRKGYVWAWAPEKVKYDAKGKAKICAEVEAFIEGSSKLKKSVSRVDMRGNWVYLYQLVERFEFDEDSDSAVPHGSGTYNEFKYARIAIQNKAATVCTVDYQRHNGEWMTILRGTFQECLTGMENDHDWFQ
jgi:hypothetical protein